MASRNIKQYAASVAKLQKDAIKFTDVRPIEENGKQVIVTAEHDEVVALSKELKHLANQILVDEREYADQELLSKMMQDKNLLAQYAAQLAAQNGSETPAESVPATAEVEEKVEDSSVDDIDDDDFRY